MDLQPAEWEQGSEHTPEEHEQIAAAKAKLNAPGIRDALNARIEAYKAEIEKAERHLADIAEVVVDKVAEVVPQATKAKPVIEKAEAKAEAVTETVAKKAEEVVTEVTDTVVAEAEKVKDAVEKVVEKVVDKKK